MNSVLDWTARGYAAPDLGLFSFVTVVAMAGLGREPPHLLMSGFKASPRISEALCANEPAGPVQTISKVVCLVRSPKRAA